MKVIHILRDIHELVASYQKRLEEGSWKRTFKTCVFEANKNNAKILSALRGPHRDRVILVEYDVLWDSEAHIFSLMREVGISRSSMERGLVMRGVSTAQSLRLKEREITVEQSEFISKNYDVALEKEVRAQARVQSSRRSSSVT